MKFRNFIIFVTFKCHILYIKKKKLLILGKFGKITIGIKTVQVLLEIFSFFIFKKQRKQFPIIYTEEALLLSMIQWLMIQCFWS